MYKGACRSMKRFAEVCWGLLNSAGLSKDLRSDRDSRGLLESVGIC